jgi:hypothetical protein
LAPPLTEKQRDFYREFQVLSDPLSLERATSA